MKLLKSLAVSIALLWACAGFAAPVDINTADAQALAEAIKGVGPKKAEAILKYREEHGSFRSVEQLADVPGVSDNIVQANRDNLTVGEGTK